LWIGAIKYAEPHVTTSMAPHVITNSFDMEFRAGRSELDRIYAASEGQPSGQRFPFPDADDDQDGVIDEDWLDGRDNDQDGLIDEDFAAISNQMFFCEYRDIDPNIKLDFPEHEPLGLLVQQSSMSWKDPSIDDLIGFDFRLINEGFDALYSVYLGFFADCDVGLRNRPNRDEDDHAGFWEGIRTAPIGPHLRNVKVSIGYMFDGDGDEGTAPGYIGVLFLGASRPDGLPSIPMANFRISNATAEYESGGDPRNDTERYRTLDGTAPQPLPPPDPVTGLRPPQMTTNEGNYRVLVSAGPFSSPTQDFVAPGDTLHFQAALVFGDGFEGMIENAARAKVLYEGVRLDRDQDPTTGVQGRETAVCPSGFVPPGSIFPTAGTWPIGESPTWGNVDWCESHAECAFAPPTDPNCWVVLREECEYINADCKIEEQTGLATGIDGKEYQLKWWRGSSTPVVLSEFVGHADGERIELAWRLSAESESELVEVRVQRASAFDGPYADLTTLQPDAHMAYVDTRIEPGRSYWYRLSLRSLDGSVMLSRPIEASTNGVRWSTALDVPYESAGGPIEIRYRVGAPGSMRLEVFDVAGRRVATLIDGVRIPGEYRQPWERVNSSGRRVARGIYVVRLSTVDAVVSRKVAVVR
jgi:hypothetical protein